MVKQGLSGDTGKFCEPILRSVIKAQFSHFSGTANPVQLRSKIKGGGLLNFTHPFPPFP